MQAGVKAIPGIITDLKAKYDQLKLADAVAMLIKLLENIENNPDEPKYRGIKRTNATLEAKVFSFKGIEQVLISAGFVPDGEFYRFEGSNILSVSQTLILLRANEVNLRTFEPESEEARKRQKEVQEELRKDQEAKQRLVEQMKHDRQEKKDQLKKNPIQCSKATDMKFGCNMKTTKDINPGMNQKGG